MTIPKNRYIYILYSFVILQTVLPVLNFFLKIFKFWSLRPYTYVKLVAYNKTEQTCNNYLFPVIPK